MAANKRQQFDRTYQRALALHLGRRRGGAKTSRSARKLGKEAAELGLGAMDVARTHDRAMANLGPGPIEYPNEQTDLPISPGAMFYIEALAPLERNRDSKRETARRAQENLERQLQREVKQHGKLLVESERQKEQVRQLTYQFLLAQDISRVRENLV